MTMRTLADLFHDHVVARTKDNWRYWVFVNIMGHFVHSFEQQVVATTFDDLQTTGLEYIGNNLTLQQLRKGGWVGVRTNLETKEWFLLHLDSPRKLSQEANGRCRVGRTSSR